MRAKKEVEDDRRHKRGKEYNTVFVSLVEEVHHVLHAADARSRREQQLLKLWQGERGREEGDENIRASRIGSSVSKLLQSIESCQLQGSHRREAHMHGR